MIVGLMGPKPAGKRSLRDRAYHLGIAVLKVVRQPEDDGIAASGVRDLVQDLFRISVAQLERGPREGRPAQVQAHADHAVLEHVIVPGVHVGRSRVHTVYPPVERIDLGADSDLPDDLEKPRVVRQEKEDVNREFVHKVRVVPDSFVNKRTELAFVDPALNRVKKVWLDEPGKKDALFAVESRSQLRHIVVRGRDHRSGSCQLDHEHLRATSRMNAAAASGVVKD
jgi:hypothetical protein